MANHPSALAGQRLFGQLLVGEIDAGEVIMQDVDLFGNPLSL
jgi:hypothetical protein